MIKIKNLKILFAMLILNFGILNCVKLHVQNGLGKPIYLFFYEINSIDIENAAINLEVSVDFKSNLSPANRIGYFPIGDCRECDFGEQDIELAGNKNWCVVVSFHSESSFISRCFILAKEKKLLYLKQDYLTVIDDYSNLEVKFSLPDSSQYILINSNDLKINANQKITFNNQELTLFAGIWDSLLPTWCSIL